MTMAKTGEGGMQQTVQEVSEIDAGLRVLLVMMM